MLSKIKKEFELVKVGFNGSAKPLKDREDLDVLAEMALRSNSKSLLKMFEKIPTLEELLNEKAKEIVVIETKKKVEKKAKDEE